MAPLPEGYVPSQVAAPPDPGAVRVETVVTTTSDFRSTLNQTPDPAPKGKGFWSTVWFSIGAVPVIFLIGLAVVLVIIVPSCQSANYSGKPVPHSQTSSHAAKK